MSLTSNLIMSFKKVQKIVTPDVPVVNTLFVITDDDIISNEEINHPISEKESWDVAIKKANSL